MSEELKIEAVVKFNDGEALVLNRPLEFKYERKGDVVYAIDQCFIQCYAYSRNTFDKAFAGRKFEIPMLDGSKIECSGQWWDAGQSVVGKILGAELISVTCKSLEGLKDCYVFYGASADRELYEEFRASYKGCVYPCREYKKIITFDDQRKSFYKRLRKLEIAKKSLIKEARKNKFKNSELII